MVPPPWVEMILICEKRFLAPVRVYASQCFETLFHRIGAGPLVTKPIGALVSGGFHNGRECEQIQCLL